MSEYSDLLKHPLWQKKRLEVLPAHNWKCDVCSADDVTLHVDHGYYERDKAPWEYENATLHCLCANCHKDMHERRATLQMLLGHCDRVLLDTITGYVLACVAVSDSDCNHILRTYSWYTLAGINDATRIGLDKLREASATAGKFSMRTISDLIIPF